MFSKLIKFAHINDKKKLFIIACDDNKLYIVKYLVDNDDIDPMFEDNYALLRFIANNNIDGVKYITTAIKKKYCPSATQHNWWNKSFLHDECHEAVLTMVAREFKHFDMAQYFIDIGIIDIHDATTFDIIVHISLLSNNMNMIKYARSFRSTGNAHYFKNKMYLLDAWRNERLDVVKYVIDNDIDVGIYKNHNYNRSDSPLDDVYCHSAKFFRDLGKIAHRYYMHDIFHYLYDSGMFETAIKITGNCKPINRSDIDELNRCNENNIFSFTKFYANSHKIIIKLPNLISPNYHSAPDEIKYKKYLCSIDGETLRRLQTIIHNRNMFHINLRHINNISIVTHDSF